MANSYFDFKQFRIEQGNCGMKVSTDACIQGAWTPVPDGPCRMLDVGAGTGLLSLMLAQRAPEARIDALEIDAAAATQAAENSAASPFADRIRIHQQDVRTFEPKEPYDLILCNPPFFINSLNSPEAARNLARHNDTLQQADLLRLFERTLKANGLAAVLLPFAESNLFTVLAAQHGWFLHQMLSIKDHEAAKVKRVVSVFARIAMPVQQDVLIIKNAAGDYTPQFRKLMAPFYLHL